MPTIAITNVVGFDELQRQLNALGLSIRTDQFIFAVMRAATPGIRRIFRRNLVAAIRNKTTRRTGRLLRVRMRTRYFRAGNRIVIRPQFPSTAYTTRTGKTGQYGYVVNHYRRFIEEAITQTQNSPELSRIISEAAVKVLTTRYPLFQRG